MVRSVASRRYLRGRISGGAPGAVDRAVGAPVCGAPDGTLATCLAAGRTSKTVLESSWAQYIVTIRATGPSGKSVPGSVGRGTVGMPVGDSGAVRIVLVDGVADCARTS
ncbi:hypothetical protein [Amycolatopsis sp. NPDC003861]